MGDCIWMLSDEAGPGNPLGRRILGKAVVSWMKEGISAMVKEIAIAQEGGQIKEAEERMGTGHNLVALAQPYLLARPMPEGLEPPCLRASLHYSTIFDHYQRELRVALQASQVHETFNESFNIYTYKNFWVVLGSVANAILDTVIGNLK
jgi:hypothetical protein